MASQYYSRYRAKQCVHSRAIRPWFPAVSDYRQLQSQILAYIGDATTASFDELALAAHAFQKANCSPLRAYSESICANPTTWHDIPPIPTEAFKSANLPITAFPPKEATKTFLTSGTSGETRGAHQFLNTTLYDLSIRTTWRDLALPDLPIICLTQPPTVDSTSSLIHMFATLGGRFLIGSDGKLDPAKLNALLTHTREPILLAGTALSFLHLFESGVEITPLPAGSYALETGGYKGSGRDIAKAELYALFQKYLGLPTERVINEYSMTELSSQFYTTGLGHPHRAPHWLRARVLKPGSNQDVADGETGLLAIYDLANLGSSLAIMTRDLATRHGDRFELLGRDPNAVPRGWSRAADELHRIGSVSLP
jgi:hypothetical protein